MRSQLASGVGCVQTTSMGRLFDGVASLLGVRHAISYEAQAAIELEALARTSHEAVELTMDVEGDQLKAGSAGARRRRGSPGRTQSGGTGAGVPPGARRRRPRGSSYARRSEQGVDLVGLTGGVFQNRLLLDELAAGLRSAGLSVLTHRRVPPNDGGLSLGQAAVGQGQGRPRSRGHDRRRHMTTTHAPASLIGEELSDDLASASLSLARKFHAGATLWVISPQWEPHAHHVAVEFVHPGDHGQACASLGRAGRPGPGRPGPGRDEAGRRDPRRRLGATTRRSATRCDERRRGERTRSGSGSGPDPPPAAPTTCCGWSPTTRWSRPPAGSC